MDHVRTEKLLGAEKVIVGNAHKDLVLETLNKVYVKAGNKIQPLLAAILTVTLADDKSRLIIVDLILSGFEYPGDGYFIYCTSTRYLYITVNGAAIALVQSGDINGSQYVMKAGDEMFGLLLMHTNEAPFIIKSKKMVENLNVLYHGGYSADDFACLFEPEIIDGDWTHQGRLTMNGLVTINASTIHNAPIVTQSDIVTTGSLGTPLFMSGFSGYGWRLDGETNTLTVDNLFVRKTMLVYEMVISRIMATNGSLWVTDANEVKEVDCVDVVVIPSNITNVDSLITHICNNVLLNAYLVFLTEALLQNLMAATLERTATYFAQNRYPNVIINTVGAYNTSGNTTPKDKHDIKYVTFPSMLYVHDIEALRTELKSKNFSTINLVLSYLNPLTLEAVVEKVIEEAEENTRIEDTISESEGRISTKTVLFKTYATCDVANSVNIVNYTTQSTSPRFYTYLSKEILLKDNLQVFASTNLPTPIYTYFKYCALSSKDFKYLDLWDSSNKVNVTSFRLPRACIVTMTDDNVPTFNPGDIIRTLKFLDNQVKYYDAFVLQRLSAYTYLIYKADGVFDYTTTLQYDAYGNIVDYSNRPSREVDHLKMTEELYLSGEVDAYSTGIEPKDHQVRVGHLSDVNRQNAVYITSSDDLSPFIDVMTRMNKPDFSVQYLEPKYKTTVVNVKDSDGGWRKHDVYYTFIRNMSTRERMATTEGWTDFNLIDLTNPTEAATAKAVDLTNPLEDDLLFRQLIFDLTGISDTSDNEDQWYLAWTYQPTIFSTCNVLLNERIAANKLKEQYTLFEGAFNSASKCRLGKLDGISDPTLPANKQPYGYGLYADNVFLKGEFYLSNGLTVADFSYDKVVLMYKNAGLSVDLMAYYTMADSITTTLHTAVTGRNNAADKDGKRIYNDTVRVAGCNILRPLLKAGLKTVPVNLRFDIIKRFVGSNVLGYVVNMLGRIYNQFNDVLFMSEESYQSQAPILKKLGYLIPARIDNTNCDVLTYEGFINLRRDHLYRTTLEDMLKELQNDTNGSYYVLYCPLTEHKMDSTRITLQGDYLRFIVNGDEVYVSDLVGNIDTVYQRLESEVGNINLTINDNYKELIQGILGVANDLDARLNIYYDSVNPHPTPPIDNSTGLFMLSDVNTKWLAETYSGDIWYLTGNYTIDSDTLMFDLNNNAIKSPTTIKAGLVYVWKYNSKGYTTSEGKAYPAGYYWYEADNALIDGLMTDLDALADKQVHIFYYDTPDKFTEARTKAVRGDKDADKSLYDEDKGIDEPCYKDLLVGKDHIWYYNGRLKPTSSGALEDYDKTNWVERIKPYDETALKEELQREIDGIKELAEGTQGLLDGRQNIYYLASDPHDNVKAEDHKKLVGDIWVLTADATIKNCYPLKSNLMASYDAKSGSVWACTEYQVNGSATYRWKQLPNGEVDALLTTIKEDLQKGLVHIHYYDNTAAADNALQGDPNEPHIGDLLVTPTDLYKWTDSGWETVMSMVSYQTVKDWVDQATGGASNNNVSWKLIQSWVQSTGLYVYDDITKAPDLSKYKESDANQYAQDALKAASAYLSGDGVLHAKNALIDGFVYSRSKLLTNANYKKRCLNLMWNNDDCEVYIDLIRLGTKNLVVLNPTTHEKTINGQKVTFLENLLYLPSATNSCVVLPYADLNFSSILTDEAKRELRNGEHMLTGRPYNELDLVEMLALAEFFSLNPFMRNEVKLSTAILGDIFDSTADSLLNLGNAYKVYTQGSGDTLIESYDYYAVQYGASWYLLTYNPDDRYVFPYNLTYMPDKKFKLLDELTEELKFSTSTVTAGGKTCYTRIFATETFYLPTPATAASITARKLPSKDDVLQLLGISNYKATVALVYNLAIQGALQVAEWYDLYPQLILYTNGASDYVCLKAWYEAIYGSKPTITKSTFVSNSTEDLMKMIQLTELHPIQFFKINQTYRNSDLARSLLGTEIAIAFPDYNSGIGNAAKYIVHGQYMQPSASSPSYHYTNPASDTALHVPYGQIYYYKCVVGPLNSHESPSDDGTVKDLRIGWAITYKGHASSHNSTTA